MKTQLKKWKQLHIRTIHKNPYLHLEEDVVMLPNGDRKKYYISNRNRVAVSVIAEEKGKLLIQKEYRYPVDRVMYETPGGMVNRGERPLAGAKREFEEETGFRAKEWTLLGKYFTSPSRTNLVFYVYRARKLTFVGTHPDEAEYLEHEWMSKAQLLRMIKKGTLVPQGLLAALFLYQQHT